MGRGRKPANLTKQQIEWANSNSKSAAAAARLLGVSYPTYKKYAKFYDLFEEQKNQPGREISKGYNLRDGKYALEDILKGKHPNYSKYRLKQRLIYNGYLHEQCSNCGLDEKRVGDGKVPLILDFIDGDDDNYEYDNLRLLCYNCYFYMVGNISGPKKELVY